MQRLAPPRPHRRRSVIVTRRARSFTHDHDASCIRGEASLPSINSTWSSLAISRSHERIQSRCCASMLGRTMPCHSFVSPRSMHRAPRGGFDDTPASPSPDLDGTFSTWLINPGSASSRAGKQLLSMAKCSSPIRKRSIDVAPTTIPLTRSALGLAPLGE